MKTLEDLEEQLHCAIATVTLEMIQHAQENLIHRTNVYTNGRSAFRTYALKHLIGPFQGQEIFKTSEQ